MDPVLARWLTIAVRIATVASAAWLGVMIIAAQLSRSFDWFPNAYRNSYDFGPGAIVTAVGIAVIFAVCLGIPWILSARRGP